MKNKHRLLEILNACEEALDFSQNYETLEEAWSNCWRGDWMLWLAHRLKVDKRKLTLAKSLCAKTVIHLMTDERSINAVKVSENYGKGLSTKDQLKYAAAAAYAAADSADTANAYATAVYAADAATYATDTDDDARKENRIQTSNICREILTEELFNKLKTL